MKGLDTFGALEFYDFHDKGTMKEKFPMIDPAAAEEAMIALTGDRRIFKGFYAFRQLVLNTPWLWLLVPLIYLPGSSYLGTRVYAWVARNRKSFGCRV